MSRRCDVFTSLARWPVYPSNLSLGVVVAKLRHAARFFPGRKKKGDYVCADFFRGFSAYVIRARGRRGGRIRRFLAWFLFRPHPVRRKFFRITSAARLNGDDVAVFLLTAVCHSMPDTQVFSNKVARTCNPPVFHDAAPVFFSKVFTVTYYEFTFLYNRNLVDFLVRVEGLDMPGWDFCEDNFYRNLFAILHTELTVIIPNLHIFPLRSRDKCHGINERHFTEVK